ncbi:ankyrin-1-like [Trichogramma pretiosum]|uniref:ankyrin-1-like n=1 Tax=Trichogramma pretiosum TaxID=7493 RepID=UPI000C71B2A8|nr:ankyrin-1-like [Trichogramma pretiosum]
MATETSLKMIRMCDVNYTDESGYTHFHAACQFGCVDVVREFLEHRQDPNCIWTETGNSALDIALSSEAESISDIMEMLLRGGADPNLVNKKGLTPLHIIAKEVFHCEIVELFFQINDELNQRVQVDARDKLGNTPIHLALKYSDRKKMMEVLLRRGFSLWTHFKYSKRHV